MRRPGKFRVFELAFALAFTLVVVSTAGGRLYAQASPYSFRPPGPALPRITFVSESGGERSGVIETHAEAADGSFRVLGGIFNRVNGEARLNIAAFDRDWRLLPWPVFVYLQSSPERSGEVHDVEIRGTRVFIAGAFDRVNDRHRCGLASVDLRTGFVHDWGPELLSTGFFPGIAYALAWHDDRLFVAGSFSHVRHRGHVLERISIVEFAPQRQDERRELVPTATDFGLEPDDAAQRPLLPFVLSLAPYRNALYVAGTLLEKVRGQSRGNGAGFGLHSQGVDLLDWDPRADDAIYSLAPSDAAGGSVFVGGSFTHAGGQPRNGLARLDLVSGRASPWDARLSAPLRDDRVRFVRATARGNVLYVTGQFINAPAEVAGIAAYDATTGERGYWRPFLSTGNESRARNAFVVDGRVIVDFATNGLVSYAEQRRGDGDGDGRVTLDDLVAILDYLYRAGPDLARDEVTGEAYGGDVDDNGVIELEDSKYLADFLFRDSNPPPP